MGNDCPCGAGPRTCFNHFGWVCAGSRRGDGAASCLPASLPPAQVHSGCQSRLVSLPLLLRRESELMLGAQRNLSSAKKLVPDCGPKLVVQKGGGGAAALPSLKASPRPPALSAEPRAQVPPTGTRPEGREGLESLPTPSPAPEFPGAPRCQEKSSARGVPGATSRSEEGRPLPPAARDL